MKKELCKYTFNGNSIILTKEVKIDVNEWHFKLLQDMMNNGYVQIRGEYCDDNNIPLDEVRNAFYDLLDLEIGYEDDMAWHQTMKTKSQEGLEDMFAYVSSVMELKKINEVLT